MKCVALILVLFAATTNFSQDHVTKLTSLIDGLMRELVAAISRGLVQETGHLKQVDKILEQSGTIENPPVTEWSCAMVIIATVCVLAGLAKINVVLIGNNSAGISNGRFSLHLARIIGKMRVKISFMFSVSVSNADIELPKRRKIQINDHDEDIICLDD